MPHPRPPSVGWGFNLHTNFKTSSAHPPSVNQNPGSFTCCVHFNYLNECFILLHYTCRCDGASGGRPSPTPLSTGVMTPSAARGDACGAGLQAMRASTVVVCRTRARGTNAQQSVARRQTENRQRDYAHAAAHKQTLESTWVYEYACGMNANCSRERWLSWLILWESEWRWLVCMKIGICPGTTRLCRDQSAWKIYHRGW